MKLLTLALQYLTNRLQGTVVSKLAPIGPFVKQLAFGLSSILAGVFCFLFTLLFVFISIFFFLIDQAQWGVSGLITGGIIGLIGLILVLIGRSQLDKSHTRLY